MCYMFTQLANKKTNVSTHKQKKIYNTENQKHDLILFSNIKDKLTFKQNYNIQAKASRVLWTMGRALHMASKGVAGRIMGASLVSIYSSPVLSHSKH